MDIELYILLALILCGIVALAMERLSVDVFALGIVVLLVVFGILTPAEAFSGFANEVIFILCAVFILSGAIVRSGAKNTHGIQLVLRVQMIGGFVE